MTQITYSDGYYTRIFSEVFESFEEFMTAWNESPLKTSDFSEPELELIFYNLYARYGDSHIRYTNEFLFKQRLISTITAQGRIYLKRKEIQSKLMAMSDDDTREGFKNIINAANNPNRTPGTNTNDELPYIESQSVSKGFRGKLEGLQGLDALLDSSFGRKFYDAFKPLFIQILGKQKTVYFVTEYPEEG